MKHVSLPYGHGTLDIEVPDETVVVERAKSVNSFRQELTQSKSKAGYEKVREALFSPICAKSLTQIVRPGVGVCVVFPDITRPMPNKTVLPPLLDRLCELGVKKTDITLLCATGTHREATRTEMIDLIGRDIAESYVVCTHRADADKHVSVGEISGTPIMIDERYVQATVKITTGFVEPHFFAGFSGGPKAVCPGLGSSESIFAAHSVDKIADQRATWLSLDNNPVADFVRRAASMCPPDLSIDVTIDTGGRVDEVFAGSLPESHNRACKRVKSQAVRMLERRFPVVVTTNAGHPLDQNLYQAVKGMAAGARVVEAGGTILMAAACTDGIPSGSDFDRILFESSSPEDLVFGPPGQDRWQAQVFGKVLQRAEIWLHAGGLDPDSVRRAQMRPICGLQESLDEALFYAGEGARACVLVDGPLLVATAP